MKIQVITDSTSDISQEMAAELGIRLVPIYVRFGNKVYRDGVDIKSDEFYKMLATSPEHPATSQPTPDDFEAVYKEYCDKGNGIISVHISSKISGTCNSATIAKNLLGSDCAIEVIDSQLNSAGLALVAMFAARLAKTKDNLAAVADEIRQNISHFHMFGMFNTMEYLARGGRLPKAIATAASFLNVKPLLTFKNGEITPVGLVRSFRKGIDRLGKWVEGKKNIIEMAIVHSNIPEKAEELKKLAGWFFPEKDIKIMELGPGLGVHGGPGVLLVALREGEGSSDDKEPALRRIMRGIKPAR
jgi:DegV family protein with EDD domain